MEKLVHGVLTVSEASHLLGLSERQVQRLKHRYQPDSTKWLLHGNSGRSKPWALQEETRNKVLELARTRYSGLNDSVLHRKLVNDEGLALSRETLRRILRREGIVSPRKRLSSGAKKKSASISEKPSSLPSEYGETKRRILEAAMAEFSKAGFAGARVGSIARRAKVSQQLLFHYFGSKRGLRSAAVEHFFKRVEGEAINEFSSLARYMEETYAQVRKDHDATRLLIWESFELEELDPIEDERRSTIFHALVANCAREQAKGRISTFFEPKALAMTLLALPMLPQVLPMFVRSVFGLVPEDPKFISIWKNHLGKFGEFLTPSKP
jgi:AcrR family transcriptional regulator